MKNYAKAFKKRGTLSSKFVNKNVQKIKRKICLFYFNFKLCYGNVVEKCQKTCELRKSKQIANVYS